MSASTLDAYLNSYTGNGEPLRKDIASVIRHLTTAANQLRGVINQGALGAAFAASRRTHNIGGDLQKELDVVADNAFLEALRQAPVNLYCSEELEHPVLLNAEARLGIAIDPLDGSSNIDTNVSVGTIFSIFEVAPEDEAKEEANFLRPGHEQLAAGFFIYGPQLALVLTLGSGTHVFVFSTRLGTFVQTYESIAIPPRTQEFAINISNQRHWPDTLRAYVDDCLKGAEGPREKDFNMRWIASLVAEAYRILIRGGIFLYPGDARKGYRHGRLRLVYEANPIAMLIEQAGGAATDGETRILDLQPTDLHQRTPLVFGSVREVERVARYMADPSLIGTRQPLFGSRGLFRT